MRIISSLVLYRLQQCNVYLNLGKDADSKHSPDAADAVGDERAAWIIQVWLAVEELNRISFFALICLKPHNFHFKMSKKSPIWRFFGLAVFSVNRVDNFVQKQK